jgi:hypothetical protein
LCNKKIIKIKNPKIIIGLKIEKKESKNNKIESKNVIVEKDFV